MSDMSLETLLNSLNMGIEKAAAEGENPFAKKEDGDKEEKSEKANPFEKKEDGGKEDAKDEKKSEGDDKEEKDKDGQVKEAQVAGASLAREIMEKIASANAVATPASAGQALAESLLTKRAGAGDVVSADGTSAAVPNKSQQDLATQAAESASTVNLMPTSDGNGPTGTVNEIYDALVAGVVAKGATSTDQAHETGVAKAEGQIVDDGVPHQVKVAYMKELMSTGIDFDQALEMTKQASAEYADEMEKVAAINALVDEGVAFDKAVELVKEAADELAAEAAAGDTNLVKAAAVQHLVESGVPFFEAVELVKQAGAGDMISADGTSAAVPNKSQEDLAVQKAESDGTVNLMPTSDGNGPTGSVNEIFDALVASVVAKGATSTDQAHMTGVSKAEGQIVADGVPHQVKVAKVEELVAQGIDFEKAASIVKEAAASMVVRNMAQVGKAAAKKGLSMASKGAIIGGTAGTAVGAAAGAASRGREKKAAVDRLMADGIEFDQAVSMVNAKARELYGE